MVLELGVVSLSWAREGDLFFILPLGVLSHLYQRVKSWNGQCLDSQRNEFWLAGMDLNLRFALGLLSGISSPFLLVPPVFLS